MLRVRDLHAYYGKSHILRGVDLDVCENVIVCILGRDGVGRSTTLKAIMGDPEPRGETSFRDRPIAGRKPREIAHLGIGFVPEERAIFPTLTVEQNRLFPQLKERANAPGGALSGGEQQTLTICRTLMGDPDLIMIDEPTEGLAPQMVEQRLVIALRISHRTYVTGHGRIVFEGTPAELTAADGIRREWLEV